MQSVGIEPTLLRTCALSMRLNHSAKTAMSLAFYFGRAKNCSERGLNSRPSACKADVITTRLSERLVICGRAGAVRAVAFLSIAGWYFFFSSRNRRAGMAKWQGNRFVSGRSGVRSPLPACFFFFFFFFSFFLGRRPANKVPDSMRVSKFHQHQMG